MVRFRYDKKPKDVVLEIPIEMKNKKSFDLTDEISDDSALATTAKKSVRKVGHKRLPTTEKGNWPFIEQQNQNDKTTIQLEECEIDLFNVDRKIWKDVTKADLITYYHTIHNYILPHIKDRPLSLHFKNRRTY